MKELRQFPALLSPNPNPHLYTHTHKHTHTRTLNFNLLWIWGQIMYKQARISQRCASVRLTVPLLDRFVSCGTVPFLKFHEEEPSSVRVMDTVSGVAQYLRLYQEDCARGLRWSILELLTVISIIFRRYVAVYNSNMFWLLLDGDGHMVARNMLSNY